MMIEVTKLTPEEASAFEKAFATKNPPTITPKLLPTREKPLLQPGMTVFFLEEMVLEQQGIIKVPCPVVIQSIQNNKVVFEQPSPSGYVGARINGIYLTFDKAFNAAIEINNRYQ